MFSSTGNVLCLTCNAPMRIVTIIPEDDKADSNRIAFSCGHCGKTREFSYGRAAQPVEHAAA